MRHVRRPLGFKFATVEGEAEARAPGKQFFVIKVVNHPEDGPASAPEADADAAGGQAAQIIVGAIERVDGPKGFVAAQQARVTADFFANDR